MEIEVVQFKLSKQGQINMLIGGKTIEVIGDMSRAYQKQMKLDKENGWEIVDEKPAIYSYTRQRSTK